MNGDRHLQRAQVLMSQSRSDLAEPELRQALADDPEHAPAMTLLAICLTERDALEEATDLARQAIVLQPDLSLAHFALAAAMRERNRLPEAAAAVQEAIRLDPTQPLYFAELSQQAFQRHNWQAALDAAEHGLRLDPENVGCSNLRALALERLRRTDDAAATLRATLARDPDNALSHANQGWNYLHQHNTGKALEHFREALRLDPKLEWARIGMVEAIKARNPVYGLLLRYSLWMSTLDTRVQWGILIGGFIGYRYVVGLWRAHPEAGWLWGTIVVAYVAVVLLTWLGNAAFNLVLRTSRFGRLILSPQQVLESNLIGVSLLVGLSAGALFLLLGWVDLLVLALAAIGLTIPLAGIFKVSAGWPRQAMIALAAVFAALAASSVGFGLVGLEPLAVLCFLPLPWLFIGSQIAANVLVGVSPRR